MNRLSAPFTKKNLPVLSFFAAFTLYFLYFWARVFWFDAAGNLLVGQVNMWGDWPAHFIMGSSMAYRKLLLLDSPLLIDAPFRYPFLANLLSAILIRIGVPFLKAFVWPSFVFSILSVAALYYFYKTLFRSTALGILCACIYLMNGGLGFVYFFRDLAHTNSAWKTLLDLPHYYTYLPEKNLQWQSVILSMLIPQRAFNHGLPIGVFCLSLFLKQRKEFSWQLILVTGLLVGVMPLFSAHSFMAMTGIIGTWALGELVLAPRNWEPWLKKWGTMGLIVWGCSIPVVIKLFWPTGRGGDFLSWHPGWYGDKSFFFWIVFWIKNWGPALFFALGAMAVLLWNKRETRAEMIHWLFFFLPFWILFVLANLFNFQPWLWDNTKIFAWCSLGISGLAGYFLHWLWQRRTPAAKAGAVFLGVVTMLSGTMDAYEIVKKVRSGFQLYSAEELQLAEWVKTNTPISSVWLLGTYHNHWLNNLTGRQSVMAFTGWLWTHGYDYRNTEHDVITMFDNPGATALYDKYRINYAVLGPFERSEMGANSEEFDQRYIPIKRTENIAIYDVRATDVEKATAAVPQETPLAVPPKPAGRGLTQVVFDNPDFQGTIHDKKAATTFGFHYDSDEKRPFPRPCSMIWEGFLKIPEEGIYVFNLESDDGSWLYINETLVVDNGGVHMVRKKSGHIRLSAGTYRIKMKYFDDAGGAIFHARVARLGQTFKNLAEWDLFHS